MPRNQSHASAANLPPGNLLLDVIFGTAAGVALVYGFWIFFDNALLGDEQFHLDQIQRLLRGERTLNPSLTTLPGYHLILATIGNLIGWNTLGQFRMLSFVLSIASIVVFFELALKLDRFTALPRTLQYVFLPILFFLFFLVYTDIASLLFVLLALLAFIHGRYAWAGIFAVGCMLMRQNNILWLVLFFALSLWRIAEAIRPEAPWTALTSQQFWKQSLAISIPYFAGFAVFAAFVVWNGGIALGDAQAHPFPSMHIGNIHFLLFLLFWLLLPLQITLVRRMMKTLSVQQWISALTIVVIYFWLYWFFFTNDHPYNQPHLGWFLRNRLLIWSVSNSLSKFLFFLPGGCMLLTLWGIHLREKKYYLLYPVTLLALVPSWLIEQRYYFISLACFLLLRRSESRLWEYILAVYWAVLTAALLPGINAGRYFL